MCGDCGSVAPASSDVEPGRQVRDAQELVVEPAARGAGGLDVGELPGVHLAPLRRVRSGSCRRARGRSRRAARRRRGRAPPRCRRTGGADRCRRRRGAPGAGARNGHHLARRQPRAAHRARRATPCGAPRPLDDQRRRDRRRVGRRRSGGARVAGSRRLVRRASRPGARARTGRGRPAPRGRARDRSASGPCR